VLLFELFPAFVTILVAIVGIALYLKERTTGDDE
jgi:hypothetical protein